MKPKTLTFTVTLANEVVPSRWLGQQDMSAIDPPRNGTCVMRKTHDARPVIPWTCFSVEPALCLPTFGVRTEVNVFVEERGARVSGEMQTEFVRLC